MLLTTNVSKSGDGQIERSSLAYQNFLQMLNSLIKASTAHVVQPMPAFNLDKMLLTSNSTLATQSNLPVNQTHSKAAGADVRQNKVVELKIPSCAVKTAAKSQPKTLTKRLQRVETVIKSRTSSPTQLCAEPSANNVAPGQSDGNSSPSSLSSLDGAYVINPVTGNKVRPSYKNMTVERRVEANARERTRVHTIGEFCQHMRHFEYLSNGWIFRRGL